MHYVQVVMRINRNHPSSVVFYNPGDTNVLLLIDERNLSSAVVDYPVSYQYCISVPVLKADTKFRSDRVTNLLVRILTCQGQLGGGRGCGGEMLKP